MTKSNSDLRALQEAFRQFTKTTETMEESYRRLEPRIEQLDRELAAKNRELALTSDYLNSILESMSDGVIAVDTQGTITTFNRAASDVLGYAADETVGREFREVFGREFTVPLGPHAMELVSKTGVTVPVSERDSPLSDRTGKRIGMVKVFQDLSEIESLREQVRQMDRLAAIGEMAATVAHEIRNPLGGIRGFALLLARDVDGDDPRARLVEKILEGTKALDRVVNELLEYTRPVELQLRSVNCADLVSAAISFVELDQRPTIAIINEVEPELTVLADPDKIRQVFLNILLNAVQSIQGEGEIRIAATVNGDNDAVTVVISDTGCGMSEEQLDTAFSPFYTTKEKGTGLGLAEARKIVEAHAGDLVATSERGKGSTFFLRLPRG